jgi:hypothetical protein
LSSYSSCDGALYRFDRMCPIGRTYLIVRTYWVDRSGRIGHYRFVRIGHYRFVRIDHYRFVRSCQIGSGLIEHYRFARIPHQNPIQNQIVLAPQTR